MPGSIRLAVAHSPLVYLRAKTWMPATSAGMTAEVNASCVRNALSHRQAGVVLCERRHRRLRAGHIIDLGDLALGVEIHRVAVTVQHLRHPPGEALPLPHPAEAGRRIGLQQILAAGFDMRLDGAR